MVDGLTEEALGIRLDRCDRVLIELQIDAANGEGTFGWTSRSC